MIKVIVSYSDLPRGREVSRMGLPRYAIALVGGSSILGRAHGGLLAMTSTPSPAVEAGSDHEKIRERWARALPGKTGNTEITSAYEG